MKKKYLTSIFVTIFFLTFSSCNWLFPECDGYYIYELINYKCEMHNIIDGNNIYKITNNYETVKYDNLSISIDGERKKIGVTNNCSYMQDSFVNYITKIDIYSETDYNQEFPAGKNLNLLFYDWISSKKAADAVNYNYNRPSVSYYLETPPSVKDTFIFTIDIEINDGRSYNFETLPIIITP